MVHVKEPPAPVDEWFVLEVLASGKRVHTKVNGKTVATLTYPEAKRGHVALQAPVRHRGTVVFRTIEIKAPPAMMFQAAP
jgi:predicted amidohydrolase